jgi:hypothetical protein
MQAPEIQPVVRRRIKRTVFSHIATLIKICDGDTLPGLFDFTLRFNIKASSNDRLGPGFYWDARLKEFF